MRRGSPPRLSHLLRPLVTLLTSGAFGCTEETCTPATCDHVIERPLPEDTCGVGANDRAIRLMDAPKALSKCEGVPLSTTPPPSDSAYRCVDNKCENTGPGSGVSNTTCAQVCG